MNRLLLAASSALAISLISAPQAWNNGQAGNTGTNTAAECKNPPYATHDWIADHALDAIAPR